MNPPGPLLVQGVAFAVAALTGVALGLALDGYRAVRYALRPTGLAAHALDVALVVVALPVTAAGMLAANWGELRLYPLLALTLGATAYLTLGSPLLLPVAVWILRTLARLAGALARVAVAPVLAAARGLRHLAGWVGPRLGRHPNGTPPPGSGGDVQHDGVAAGTNGGRRTSTRGEASGAAGKESPLRGHDHRGPGGRRARGRGSGRRVAGAGDSRGGGRRRL